ncbi:hypothetical protein, partial [Parabacteroides distasonis]|uniref:hypothetical protein n=1 Tax=Parabacteroides distasonis TaxID=823 RepID=UPI00132B175D
MQFVTIIYIKGVFEMIHENFVLIIMLLIIAISIIAISQKLLKIPYPITLVVIGLLIGLLNLPYATNIRDLISQKDIFGFIIISIFLPILLGEASLKLSYSHIKENLKPII